MTTPTVTITPRQSVLLAFLRGAARRSSFASSLVAQFTENASLSDLQWAAAERMLAEARGGSTPTTTVPGPSAPAAPPALDLSALPAGMYAVPQGETRLKVQIDRPEDGNWAGWTFVKDGAIYGEGRKYGHQKPGGTYRGEIEPELRAILADPIEAMAAYGRLTGTCGLCHRPLEQRDSVARGIGPVCIKKMRAAA